MRFLPQSGCEWGNVALLPFKVYTVVAAPAALIWGSLLTRRGLEADAEAIIVAGYFLSGLVLGIIGFHQVFTSPRDRGLLNLMLGAVGLFVGIWLAKMFSPG